LAEVEFDGIIQNGKKLSGASKAFLKPGELCLNRECYIETGRIADMAIKNPISEIDGEIARLEQIRALLSGTASPAAKRGRPAGVVSTTKPAKRVMSPEARARIAAAQKKRWAKQKAAANAQAKAAKSVATKTPERKTE
jgi:hypothetical protein